MSNADGENVLGALLFFAYIGSALCLTGLICRDLLIGYSSMQKQPQTETKDKNKKDRKSHAVQDRHFQIYVLAALSFLSFAVLSYHMLSFLIQSYQSWSPSDSLSDISPWRIWKWSTSSTLFQDFAEAINNDPGRSWWTSLALTYSLGWNLYMTVEGVRYDIPHLWAYFLLDQILPVSFTQNLFLEAVLLQRHNSHTSLRSLQPLSPVLQVLLVLAFVGVLGAGPSSVGKAWFTPVLFTTRALLLAPFLLLRPRIIQRNSDAGDRARSSSPARHVGQHESRWALALIIASFACQLVTGFSEFSIAALSSALNSSPAVSALGYDVLIGILSLGASIVINLRSTN